MRHAEGRGPGHTGPQGASAQHARLTLRCSIVMMPASKPAPSCGKGWGIRPGFPCKRKRKSQCPKAPSPSPILIQKIAEQFDDKLTRKDVKGIIEAVATIGQAELKKNGVFVVPGLIRMVVVKKPATKARKGINPFTKEETIFKAKPARKVVKGRPVKAVKDAVA